MWMRIAFYTLLNLSLVTTSWAINPAITTLWDDYRAQGATTFSAQRGESLWRTQHASPRGKRACTDCHTADLRQNGKHVRTGKVIAPMAPSVNPKRLTQVKKIEKWFKRNCKWTLGRECTPQEKGDLLMYLIQQ